MYTKKIISLVIASAVCVIVSCDSGGSSTDDSIIAVEGISMNTGTIFMLVNGTKQLSAVVTPANATDPSLYWSSSDENKAIISSTGLVTAKALGDVTITVTTVDGKKTASSTVKVVSSIEYKMIYSLNNYTTKAGGIYERDMDGANQTVIAECSGDYYYYNPSSSSDGQKIVFENHYQKEYSNIMIINSDASGITNLTNNTTSEIDYLDPSFSPDGTKIVYRKYNFDESAGGIFEMDINGQNTKTIKLFSGNDFYSNPSYSPDGCKIIFENSVNKEYSNIFIVNRDGTNLVNITGLTSANMGIQYLEPTISSDNSKIIYRYYNSNETGLKSGIYSMDLNGKNQVSILSNELNDFYSSPSLSPLMDKIIFSCEFNSKAYYSILIMDSDGLNKTDVIENTDEDLCYDDPSFIAVYQ